jgi:AraC family transcriptional activator of pobA
LQDYPAFLTFARMNKNLNLPFEWHLLDSSEKSVNVLKELMSKTNGNQLIFCSSGSLTIESEERLINVTGNSLLIHSPMRMLHVMKVSQDFKATLWVSRERHGMMLVNRVLDMPTQMSIMNNPLLKVDASTFEELDKKMTELRKMASILNQTDVISSSEILYRLILSMAMTLAYGICYLFAARMEKPLETIDHGDGVVTRFLLSLNKNYKEQRSVKFYAEEQNLQSSYFSSIIKNKTGRTAGGWIDEVVVAGAKDMLIWQDESIAEIARRMNFASQSFFGKFFKKHVGMSPKKFRLNKSF